MPCRRPTAKPSSTPRQTGRLPATTPAASSPPPSSTSSSRGCWSSQPTLSAASPSPSLPTGRPPGGCSGPAGVRAGVLVGHSSMTTTETIYRKQIRPAIIHGAEVMDRIFRGGGSRLSDLACRSVPDIGRRRYAKAASATAAVMSHLWIGLLGSAHMPSEVTEWHSPVGVVSLCLAVSYGSVRASAHQVPGQMRGNQHGEVRDLLQLHQRGVGADDPKPR